MKRLSVRELGVDKLWQGRCGKIERKLENNFELKTYF